jgi:hypothetical protein
MPVTRSGRTNYTYVDPHGTRPAGETPPGDPAAPETSPQSPRGRAPPGVPGQRRPSRSASPGAESSARVRSRSALPTRAAPAEAGSSSSAPRAAAGNAIDEARADIRANMDFVTVCSALEVGVPARVSAAISLIADGTVGPGDFFHAHAEGGRSASVIRNLIDVYGSPHRPDLSRFQEGLAPTRLERLSGDIDCLRQLLAACAHSPHPEIQDAARRYEAAPACFFLHRIASMPREHHAEAINLVAPMLDELLHKLAQGHAVPRISAVVQALEGGHWNAAIHPDVRQACYSYGLRILAHQPASPEKAKQAVGFVLAARLVPPEHQQDAIKTALQLIVEIPQDVLDPQARRDELSHPLTECAYALEGVHDDVFGKSAIDLLRASKGIAEDIDLQFVICKAVGEVALSPGRDSGQVPFARLHEGDKVRLFLEMLGASIHPRLHQMGDARTWGPQMLPYLPQSVQQEAGVLLRLAENGRSPLMGFELAARNWRW